MMASAVQLFRLAASDLADEWPVALAQVVAIAAVLTPLLVLFGLREGAIGTLIERLDRDPAMRLVTPEATGAQRYDAGWFAEMAARRDVAFVTPATRLIAGQIDLLREGVAEGGTARGEVRVTLLPTGTGDPVAGPAAATLDGQLDRVVLSARAAERLGVSAGATITGYVERVLDGRTEPLALRLAVAGVLPLANDGGMTAFAALPLLQAVQDFRDGSAVPALGVERGGPAKPAADYPLFRLYARSIRDVGGLAADLQARGIAVATRGAEIASTLALDASLRAVLLIVAALSVGGYAVAVTATQWGNLRRKRRVLAILNLAGYGSRWLVGFPVVQALLLAVAGGAVSAAAFTGVATLVNARFAATLAAGEAACSLPAGDLLAAAGATVLLSVLPAAAVGAALRRIDLTEELRHV